MPIVAPLILTGVQYDCSGDSLFKAAGLVTANRFPTALRTMEAVLTDCRLL